MDKQDYFYSARILSTEESKLLALAGLPLLDGFFLTFLASNMWQDVWQVVVFGLSAFSGAGCFILAMQLEGTTGQRVFQVIKVYILVATGATVITMASPIFISLLPANLYLFTGFFLLGLGCLITGNQRLQDLAKRLGTQQVVTIMVIASLLHGLFSGIDVRVGCTMEVLAMVWFSVGVGWGLSMLGMLAGMMLRGASNRKPLDYGAGFSLCLMGFRVLGAPLASYLVILPLTIGLIWTVLSLTLEQ